MSPCCTKSFGSSDNPPVYSRTWGNASLRQFATRLISPCFSRHRWDTGYLNPLSIHRLARSNEQPLIDAVAKRIPACKGNLLNLAGHATLSAVTLSAIPTHVSIVVCLSPWAVAEIDKRRRAFLWAGTDRVSGGKCRVAWEVTCRPRDLGGLGLLLIVGIPCALCWGRNPQGPLEQRNSGRSQRRPRSSTCFGWHYISGVGRQLVGIGMDCSSLLHASSVEWVDHLLLSCSFSQEVCSKALGLAGLADLLLLDTTCFWSWWVRSRKRIAKDSRRGFDSMVLLVGWQLWKERNSRTFNAVTAAPTVVFNAIIEEANLWVLAGYRCIRSLLPLILAISSQTFDVN